MTERSRPRPIGDSIRALRAEITIACAKATWAQELDLLQNDLLVRLNEALGEPRVRRLRFVVGSNPFSAQTSS